MLIERHARAQERRVAPDPIAHFLREAAEFDLETRRGVTPYLRPGATPLRAMRKPPTGNCPHLPTAIRAFPLTEGERRSTISNG